MEVMAYSTPTRKRWRTQIEFLDGSTVEGTDDADALDRWLRLAAWGDPAVIDDPSGWLDRVLARARAFYGATLSAVHSGTPPTELLDALAAERVVEVRRR